MSLSRFMKLAISAALVITIPVPASAQVRRVINFYNDCWRPIEFLINHADNGGNWHAHGWYRLRPNQTSTFQAHGVVLTQMDGFALYFYARTTDGSGLTWTGNNHQPFGQAIYPFMEMSTGVLSDGSLSATISCNS